MQQQRYVKLNCPCFKCISHWKCPLCIGMDVYAFPAIIGHISMRFEFHFQHVPNLLSTWRNDNHHSRRLLFLVWDLLRSKRKCFHFRNISNSFIYGRKIQFAMCEIKDVQCTVYNSSPKISHNFKGINQYVQNPWQFCVYSIIRYWHHVKFETSHRITNWAPTQKRTKVWLRVQYHVIWYPNENLLKSWVLKFRTRSLSKQYSYKWTRFSIGLQMARYYTLSHTHFCHFDWMLRLLYDDWSQILRHTNNEILNIQTFP